MSDLDDLASASAGPSSPSSPSARPAAGKPPGDQWKPAQRQLEPGELPGPSDAVIISLAILGVLLLAGGVYLAVRSGKPDDNAASTAPQTPHTNRPTTAAPPADTDPATAPAATQPGRPAPAATVRKPPARPVAPPPPPADNFASAKEAVEVSAQVVAGDTVRVAMRNKSRRWVKGLLVFGYTKDDPQSPVGQFGSEWLPPGGSLGGDVEWQGISNLLKPGEAVPKLVVQEAEFSQRPTAPAKQPAPPAGAKPAR